MVGKLGVELIGDDKGLSFSINSVFKGEVPFLEFSIPGGDGKNISVGKLWGTKGKLSFEGNADKNAEIFFNEIIKRNEHRLKAET